MYKCTQLEQNTLICLCNFHVLMRVYRGVQQKMLYSTEEEEEEDMPMSAGFLQVMETEQAFSLGLQSQSSLTPDTALLTVRLLMCPT